jgi:hypothetical protein
MTRKKNRRRERRHVLDVKLSSNQVRRRRTQWLLSALFALAFLTVTIYGLWRGGWWAVQRFVYRNDQLQVRHFHVRTDGVILTNFLYRWANVTTNDHLFALELHAMKRELELHGMIRQASFERVLPDTLRLQVTERVPLARVRLRFGTPDGRLQTREFGLDRTGRVMPLDRTVVRPETAAAWQDLPEITGIHQREILPGNDVTNQLARAALSFLGAFGSSDMAGLVKLASIDVSEPEILGLRTTQQQFVKLLDRDFERQLARWAALHRFCHDHRYGYESLNLSPTNNVAIRLIQLAALPPVNPLSPR